MEVLFFRIGKKLCATTTNRLEEVVYKPDLLPCLPLTPYVKEVVVRHDHAVGVVDISLFSSHSFSIKKGILLFYRCEETKFCIKVSKILQIRRVSESKLVTPQQSTFLHDEILVKACKVKNVHITVISPEKILHHKDIKPLWHSTHAHQSMSNGRRRFVN